MLAWEVVRQGDPDRGSTFSAGAFPDTNLIQGVNKNDWRLNLSTIQSGIENRLWSIADELRANSQLRPSEYSAPCTGADILAVCRPQIHAGGAGDRRNGLHQQHRPDIRISSTWCLLPSGESTFSAPAGLTGGRGHCTGYQRCDAGD